jgi:membrane associated rhomboid family serine protease
MAEVPIPVLPGQALRLDVCVRCQFLWFDPHEFEHLPKAPTRPDATKELPEKVREAIALADFQAFAKKQRGQDYGSEPPDEAWKWIPAMLGLPVEHDLHPVRSWPWATWGLATALVIATLATLSNLEGVVREFGLIPAEALRRGGLTLITSFFLHAGLFHLIANAYYLLVFGDNVEDYLGRLRFLGLLVAAALAGDVLHILGDPRSHVPCVGASGGISGIIVYYTLQFPEARLGLLIRYWLAFKWFYFPAYFALIAWVLLQIIGAYLQVKGVSNVSALAHIGGSGVGLIAWLIWRGRRPAQRLRTAPSHESLSAGPC